MTLTTNFFESNELLVAVRRLPNVEFFIQKVDIPGISGSGVPQPNPFTMIQRTYDNLTYDQLSLTFKVDEELKTFREIHDWMRGIAFPEQYPEYKNIKNSEFGLYSDISLVTYTSKNNKKIEFLFKKAFPVTLGSIPLDVTAQDIDYPECQVTFIYDTYDIIVS